jgi:hypothetical protein
VFKSGKNIIIAASIDPTEVGVSIVASYTDGVFDIEVVVVKAVFNRVNYIDRFFRAFGAKTKQFIFIFPS